MDIVGSKKEETNTPLKKIGFWKDALKTCEKDFNSWKEDSKKINDKYKAKSTIKNVRELNLGSDAKYNILWANIQILLSALYARTPKPDVERRHKDSNPISRITAEVLERAISYEMDNEDFDGIILASVLDYLLSARGTLRVIYEPKFEGDTKVDESAKLKFVFRDDFRHGPGRIWSEVSWVAFQTYETRDTLVEKFGEKIGAEIPLDSTPNKDINEKDRSISDNMSRACIWEIWDKDTKDVYWISLGYPKILKTVYDPLRLKDFFPCPKPFYATVSTDNLIPVPDYILYQTHAVTLDVIQQRLVGVLDAAHANGVYNAAWGVDLTNILRTGDGKMTPVTNYSDLAKAGGLKGIMEFVPIEQFLTVLSMLNESAAIEVQKIYEITGISDIIRGSTDPNETAKAQAVKQKYGNLRLSSRQVACATFIKEGISLIGEVICNFFEPDRIRNMSGYDLMIDATPEDPTQWAQVTETLKNEFIRCYSIDIETDSTLAIDTQEQKESWSEYTEAVGGFLEIGIPLCMQAPSMAPYIKETLLAKSRAYKCGTGLEESLSSSFDSFIQQLQQPPPPPPPDPAVQVQQMKSQDFQSKLAIDNKRVDGAIQTKNKQIDQKGEFDFVKLEQDIKKFVAQQKIEMEKLRKDVVVEKARLDTELEKTKLSNETTRVTSHKATEQQREAAKLGHTAKTIEAFEKENEGKPKKEEKKVIHFKVERDPKTGLMTNVIGTEQRV